MQATDDFDYLAKINGEQLTEEKQPVKWRIPPIVVHAGEIFHVAAGNIRIWMVFPAPFEFDHGNRVEFCGEGNKFLAVALDTGGTAFIKIPEDYVNPGEEKSVRYSFMFRTGDGTNPDDWKYGDGEHSPPGMIIRPPVH